MIDDHDPRAPVPQKAGRDDASIFLPIGLIALIIIGVIAVWSFTGERTTTASNERAPVTTNVPTQTPAPK